MKRWLIGLLIVALGAAIVIPTVLAATEIKVVVDGQRVVFPDEPPYVDHSSNRTMVPARFVSEKLGATMKWKGPLNQLTFSYRDRTVSLTIGQCRYAGGNQE